MKIGILTFHRACNYGAVLQAYALQTALNAIAGVEAYILDYNSLGVYDIYSPLGLLKRKANPAKNAALLMLMLPSIMKRNRCFADFRKRFFCVERENLSQKDLPEAVQGYDSLIVGSDQVWNSELTGADLSYFLDFVPDSIRRLSYAASVGKQVLEKEEMEQIIGLLGKFETISLREPTLLPYLQEHLSCSNIRCDVDPVFLLGADEWRSMERQNKEKPYVLYFTLASGKEAVATKEFAKVLAQKKGLRTVYFSADARWFRFRDLDHFPISAPEDFIGLIDGAEYVVTSSFHATAFSIILHKPFFADVGVAYHGRIQNLLEMTGLTDRALQKGTLSQEPKPIDWDAVDACLAEGCARAKQYLRNIAQPEQFISG